MLFPMKDTVDHLEVVLNYIIHNSWIIGSLESEKRFLLMSTSLVLILLTCAG